MIEQLVAILLAVVTGTACDMGTPVDWYYWNDTSRDNSNLIMTVEPTDTNDVWVFQENDGDLLVFVFREKIKDTLDAGRSDPHGECARLIKAP